MKLCDIIPIVALCGTVAAESHDRRPLSYAPKPAGQYIVPKPEGTESLLDFIRSRSDLSVLAEVIANSSGFTEAFDTIPTWDYTFFAPSNAAFNNTGQYFKTFSVTPKGKFWLGNVLQHHYVPNTKLNTTTFNSTYTRFQTGTYLFVGAQTVGDNVVLNKASTINEGNLPVTKGIVHIIDRILDPSAMIFEADILWTTQKFIAGSCSNPNLAYC
ncbi:FAS1 domain-containing protein [Pseudomassariella vexata]|uniref:FAS1 domain-containing protein n=1 Tax=Pseudomassariella vexata TaxID=1141098 RepID=A0A1Y2DHX5_9PEZI|nr:FAS1 domain-containing protein [Pseudomassariella vexata]ORY58838.1 FAS1 domain-containing protein [Pseudomassariella vexata]